MIPIGIVILVIVIVALLVFMLAVRASRSIARALHKHWEERAGRHLTQMVAHSARNGKAEI